MICLYKILFNILNENIYFNVEELNQIQSSDDPFTIEELMDLLNTELDRTYEKMNIEAVEFYLDEIDRLMTISNS